MHVDEIGEILESTVLTGDHCEHKEIETACGCDLISDVLTFVGPNTVLLTGLTTPQIIYAAEMVDVKVICFVRGKKPEGDTVRMAETKGILLMSTPFTMFESCGRLYSKGLSTAGADQKAK